MNKTIEEWSCHCSDTAKLRDAVEVAVIGLSILRLGKQDGNIHIHEISKDVYKTLRYTDVASKTLEHVFSALEDD